MAKAVPAEVQDAVMAVGAVDDLLRVNPDDVPAEHLVACFQAAGRLAGYAFDVLREKLLP